jgi:phosphoribosylformimino-5-aminoimidazole carboxamide ribotide isomerase
MEVIPVIDLRGGVVVAARRGDRARYRPLETPLAASADPVVVALGLRSLYPFSTLYVADLDGIEGRGPDLATQHRLAAAWPGELWLDDGTAGSDNADVGLPPTPGGGDTQRTQMRIHPVLGSETLTSLADYESARKAAGATLSLDFRGDTFIGPPGLLDDAALWPGRVIVMTLARVGSGEGPDTQRLAEIVARAGARRVYAAGGVRHVADLHALRAIGVAGALVATSLHDGRLSRRDLEEVMT